MKHLAVPYFKQDTGYTCGPTSLQMIFAYYGIRESETRLMEELGTTRADGTPHGALIEAVRARGLHCYVNDQSSLHEVRYLLSCDAPMIVHFLETSEDEDHYSVVVGAFDASILLNDPWNGEHIRLTDHAFMNRWRSRAVGDSRQWLMAITETPLPLGRQYHPETAV